MREVIKHRNHCSKFAPQATKSRYSLTAAGQAPRPDPLGSRLQAEPHSLAPTREPRSRTAAPNARAGTRLTDSRGSETLSRWPHAPARTRRPHADFFAGPYRARASPPQASRPL